MAFLELPHHKRQHQRSATNCPASVTPIDMPPFQIDPEYEDIYVTFRKHIESYWKDYLMSAEINFQLQSFTNDDLTKAFESVYENQTDSFKISISFSYILLNKETGELAFYSASRNNQRLFDDTNLITCDNDFRRVKNCIQNVDLESRVIYPNTKFVYVKTTNVVFFLTKMVGSPIGAPVELPIYLKKNKGLISLVKSQNNQKKTYSDNLCLFRCLALFNGFKVDGLERETKRLFNMFCEKMLINPVDFCGVYLEDLESISKVFDIGINVYDQKSENRETELIFRTVKQDNILYLNLFGNHFSYISDFSKYSNSYKCVKCEKIFHNNSIYHRHTRTCDGSTRKIYYNGTFKPSPTIFEELEMHGIKVSDEKTIFPYRITFDCEAYLTKDTPQDTQKVEYTYKHNLASISICSNVPDFEEAKCFVSNGNPDELVKDAVSYMLTISARSYSLLTDEYKDYLNRIVDNKLLYEKFQCYLQQIPVLGFNNAKYDLKVMRDYFIPALLELDSPRFVIKKGTAYTCIATSNLKFLDICSYLAPGYNYDSFLKAYGSETQKSYFPYQWFDSLSRLEETEFPPYKAFYSSLKSRNTLEPVVGEVLSEEEKYIIGRTPDKKKNPLKADEQLKIGQFRYQKVQKMFIENGWSMKQYLIYYNNLDVGPFIAALKNFSQYYVDRSVDVFKDAISGKTNTYYI